MNFLCWCLEIVWYLFAGVVTGWFVRDAQLQSKLIAETKRASSLFKELQQVRSEFDSYREDAASDLASVHASKAALAHDHDELCRGLHDLGVPAFSRLATAENQKAELAKRLAEYENEFGKLSTDPDEDPDIPF